MDKRLQDIEKIKVDVVHLWFGVDLLMVGYVLSVGIGDIGRRILENHYVVKLVLSKLIVSNDGIDTTTYVAE